VQTADDELIIDAGSAMCCERDPDKADQREWRVQLNERYPDRPQPKANETEQKALGKW
jgi:hypothetical protein